ncbi:MAG: hypothetical protein EAZ85_14640 [Bacteroidetes bacterium]|nr:MAG: hypothetical protein EAZ85_14640 [Bacteroidota bacterium]TAG88504.1 MAG: hypothetical protein EAZ20_08440 [Bacteroidota bacterium]
MRKPLQIPASLSNCHISERSAYLDSLVQISSDKYVYDTTNASQILNNRFSNRSIILMRDLNLYSLLTEFTRQEQKNKNTPSNPDFLYLKQEISQRLLIAESDISTNLAELECEKTRINAASSYLADYNQTRINRATMGAILSGVISGVLTGAVALYNPDSSNTQQQVLTIAGAVAGGYFGVKAFGTKRKINFLHARNHLKEIWEKREYSQNFSPSIWIFMRKEFRSKGKTTNGLDMIINSWKAEGILDESAKNYQKKINLLIKSNGGAYSSSDLQDRLNMLVVIQQEIDVMKYDLKRVQQEILLGYKL